MVDNKVDVIVTVSGALIRASEKATTSIPIVFLASGDPTREGLAASFVHPGGNATGLAFLDEDLMAKRLDLLRELIPGLEDVAAFGWLGPPGPQAMPVLENIGQMLGLQIHGWALPTVDSFEPAFQAAAAAKVGAVDVLAFPFFNAHRERLGQLAAQYRLPAIYESADYVRSGCLMGYGPVFTAMARRGASYVDKILKGAEPGDLPIEITSNFELSINLKVADALGLTVPPALLAEAAVLVE